MNGHRGKRNLVKKTFSIYLTLLLLTCSIFSYTQPVQASNAAADSSQAAAAPENANEPYSGSETSNLASSAGNATTTDPTTGATTGPVTGVATSELQVADPTPTSGDTGQSSQTSSAQDQETAQTPASESTSTPAADGETPQDEPSSDGETPLPSDLTKGEVQELPETDLQSYSNFIDESLLAEARSVIDASTMAELRAVPASKLPAEGGGSKIENVNAEWIDVDPQTGTQRELADQTKLLHLDWTQATNSPKSVRMAVNFQLSGQEDYSPGSIQLSVPKYIFQDRNTPAADIGTLTCAASLAPDDSKMFTYTDTGTAYLITNTRTLSAATTAKIEFTIKDLKPSDIKDYKTGYQSADFFAALTLNTKRGVVLGMNSHAVRAEVDTAARLLRANKSNAGVMTEYPSKWPVAFKPSNAGDYVYVEWRISAYNEGTQPYSIKISDNARYQNGANKDAIVLGYKMNADQKMDMGNHTGTIEAEILRDGYVDSGTNFYGSVYVAYPRRNFQIGTAYKLENQVTYTLTPTDDRTEVSTATAESSLQYQPLGFPKPMGHYYVFKYGHGDQTRCYDPEDPDEAIEGVYPLALNRLKSGQNVDLSYRIQTQAFTYKWTYADGTTGENPEDYGKHPVHIATEDFYSEFNLNGREMTSADFEIKSVLFQAPRLFRYGIRTDSGFGYVVGDETKVDWVEAGSWGFLDDNDYTNKAPLMTVYGKTDNGSWVQYATVTWKNSSPSWPLAVINPQNGASVSAANVLAFPHNVTDYKVEFSTAIAGILYDMYPTLTLKADSQMIKDNVAQLYQNSVQPSTKVYNDVRLNISGLKNQPDDTVVKRAQNDLSGATIAAKQYKKSTVVDDKANSKVDFNYEVTVKEQTNMADKSLLDQALSEKVINSETGGTWYDLLPIGVEPDLSTVRLRDGDAIRSVEAIPNFRNSGRTLLVVKGDFSPNWQKVGEKDSIIGIEGYGDELKLYFTGSITYDAIKANDVNGKTIRNVVAFESDNDYLGLYKGLSGEPDDPTKGFHDDSKTACQGVEKYLTDLDPNTNGNKFIYAYSEDSIAVNLYLIGGLAKKVSVNRDNKWNKGLGKDERNVYEGGIYQYQLSYYAPPNLSIDQDNRLKNVVIYDKLETFKPKADPKDPSYVDSNDQTWRGELINVDLSQLKRAGIQPVIYYSTRTDLILDDSQRTGHTNLQNSSIWTTVMPSNRKAITAIAIDAGKDVHGQPFILQPDSMIAAYVTMRAPTVANLAAGASQPADWYDVPNSPVEAGLAGGAHAYNNVSMTSNAATDGPSVSPNMIVENYVKVGLLPYQIQVKKSWNDSENRDGLRPAAVTLQLMADGADVPGKRVTLNDGNQWQDVFKDIPATNSNGKLITYTFREEPAVKGYTLSQKSMRQTAGGWVYELENIHHPEQISLKGHKTWVANGHKVPGFLRLKLYANDVFQGTKIVRPNLSGEWKYAFDGLYKYDNKKLITYRVEEDIPLDAGEYDNWVKETVKTQEGFDFVNTWNDKGDVSLTKTVSSEDQSYDTNKEFTFKASFRGLDGLPVFGDYAYSILNANQTVAKTGVIAHSGSFSLKPDQRILIKDLPTQTTVYFDEDYAKGYQLITSPENLHTEVAAGKETKLTAVNEYIPKGNIALTATKRLVGRDGHVLSMKGEGSEIKPVGGTFSFELYDVTKPDKRVLVGKAWNDNTGLVRFNDIKYGAGDAGDHYYEIVEKKGSSSAYTYAANVEKVKVTVVDNKDGTMNSTATYYQTPDQHDQTPGEAVFDNQYRAVGKWEPVVFKKIRGGFPVKDQEFTFQIVDDTTTPKKVLAEAKNAADGTIKFPAIEFNETDIGGKMLKIVEVKGSDPNTKYDEIGLFANLYIMDNRDGSLTTSAYIIRADGSSASPTFINEKPDGRLRIAKAMADSDFDPNDEFEFKIKIDLPPDILMPEDFEYTREPWQPTATPTATPAGNNRPDAEEAANAGSIAGASRGIAAVTPALAKTNQAAENADPTPADANSTPEAADSASPDAGRPLARANQTAAQISAAHPTSGAGSVRLPLMTGTAAWINLPPVLLAALPSGSASVLDSGTNGTGIKWTIYDNGELVIAPATPGGTGVMQQPAPSMNPSKTGWEWANSAQTAKIKSVRFEAGVSSGENLAYVFSHLPNLESIDFTNLDTRFCKKMGQLIQESPNLSSIHFPQDFSTASLESDGAVSMFSAGGYADSTNKLTKLDLSFLKLSNVTSLKRMFFSCESLKEIVFPASLDVSKVSSMTEMFRGCRSLTTLKLPEMNTQNLLNTSGMFYGCSALSSLTFPAGFDTSKVTNMNQMFGNCRQLPSLDLSNFRFDRVAMMTEMFRGCENLGAIHFPAGFSTPSLKKSNSTFYSCRKLSNFSDFLSGFTTEGVTDMSFMFAGCSAITSLTLPESFSAASLTDARQMFFGCGQLQSLTFPDSFNTANVRNMSSMFSGDKNLVSLRFPSSFTTDSVTDMSHMFASCSALGNMDFLKQFHTGAVTSMDSMFMYCSAVKSLDLSSFNTGSVRSMVMMFSECENLTSLQFGTTFNTANVQDMRAMFQNCPKLKSLDLAAFNTSKVADMSYMFNMVDMDRLDLTGFDMGQVENQRSMLAGSFRELVLGPNLNLETSRLRDIPRMNGFNSTKNTGKWVVKGQKQPVYTSDELINAYTQDKAANAQTWVWEETDNTYRVTFKPGTLPNGEQIYGSMPPVDLPVGRSSPLPRCGFYAMNYEPDYYTDDAGRRINVSESASIIRNMKDPVTLTLHWARIALKPLGMGQYSLTLRGNEVANLKLPAGARYTVTEVLKNGYKLLDPSNNLKNGTIESGITKTEVFTNQKLKSGEEYPLEAHITAQKLLNGKPAQGFSFKLSRITLVDPNMSQVQIASEEMVQDGVSADENGVITFGKLTYPKAPVDEYYKITETKGSDPNITYDETVIYVRVKADGKSPAEVTYSYPSIPADYRLYYLAQNYGVKDVQAFQNTSKAAEKGNFILEKKVEGLPEGATLKPTFWFNVMLTSPDETVQPTQTIEVNLDESNAYTFDYAAGYYGRKLLPGTKIQVTEMRDPSAPTAFTLKSITNGGQGEILGGQTLRITAVNQYTVPPCSVNLRAKKVLSNGKLEAGQFHFTLTDVTEPGVPVKKGESVNDENGEILFDTVSFDKEGVYRFDIKEVDESQTNAQVTYDPGIIRAKVSVKLQPDGTLKPTVEYSVKDQVTADPTFTNSLKDTASIALSKKVINGTPKARAENDFKVKVTFLDLEGKELTGEYSWERTLTDPAASTAPPTPGTPGTQIPGAPTIPPEQQTGKIKSGDLLTIKDTQTLTIKNLPVNMRYELVEQDASDRGFKLTKQEGTSGVISPDHTAVTALLENTYHAEGKWQPQIRKKMFGGLLENYTGQFSFRMMKDGFRTLIEEKTNGPDEQHDNVEPVSFTPISYSLADMGKTFVYEFMEVSGRLPHMIYDGSRYRAKVTLTDDGQGHITPVAVYYRLDGLMGQETEVDEAVFSNRLEYVLPSSGGLGDLPYLAGGAILFGATLAFASQLLKRRRRNREA